MGWRPSKVHICTWKQRSRFQNESPHDMQIKYIRNDMSKVLMSTSPSKTQQFPHWLIDFFFSAKVSSTFIFPPGSPIIRDPRRQNRCQPLQKAAVRQGLQHNDGNSVGHPGATRIPFGKIGVHLWGTKKGTLGKISHPPRNRILLL